MDVFSHGLWAGAGTKAINLKKEKPLRTSLAIAFGAFPDVFAFAIPMVYLNFLRITGNTPPFYVRPGELEPPLQDVHPIYRLAHYLYNFSHSLLIFLIIFGIAAWYFRRPVWEMGGWLLHILVDIPTHSLAFFPTPFLWPLSGYMFNGTHWGTRNFILINYSLLTFTYIILWLASRLKKLEARKNRRT